MHQTEGMKPIYYTAFRRLSYSFPGVRLLVWDIRRKTILKSVIKDRVEKHQQLPECLLWVKQDGVRVGKGEGAGEEQKSFPRLDLDR